MFKEPIEILIRLKTIIEYDNKKSLDAAIMRLRREFETRNFGAWASGAGNYKLMIKKVEVENVF